MRRRQRYQQLRDEGILDKAPLVLVEQVKNPFPRRWRGVIPFTPRDGYCPYCNKRIGTGIFMHMKHCTKNIDAVFDWKMKARMKQIQKAKRDAEREKARKARIAAGASR